MLSKSKPRKRSQGMATLPDDDSQIFIISFNSKNYTMVHEKDIKIGTRLESHKMVMVVTGENDKYFTGYSEYKGRNAGECLLAKATLTNPHYNGDLKII